MNGQAAREQAWDWSLVRTEPGQAAAGDPARPSDVPHRIEVADDQRVMRLEPDWIEEVASAVMRAEGVPRAELSIVLVEDPAIHAVNRTHLGHDWATDVITFPLSEPGAAVLEGELVISVEAAVREAQARSLAPERELALYLVHGILHLCGHDDQDALAAARMCQRQDAILEELSRKGLVPAGSGLSREEQT